MKRRRNRKAGASKGLGRAGRIEHHHQATAPSHCVCLKPATGHVSATLLGDTVQIVIGTCDQHGPDDEDGALALVRALLLGVSRAGNDIGVEVQAGGDRHDH